MKRSDRLECILTAASHGDTAADIGTDHGFIPVELIRRGQYSRAIACDLRPEPLARAREHIEEAGLSGCIDTRQADGLAAVQPGEADTILITGMGGPLMEKILEAGSDTAHSARKLVLSPQSAIPHFRQFLLQNGYLIQEERMVFDEGKYYVVLTGEPGEAEEWSPLELRYGKCLLRAADPVLAAQLQREREELTRITEQLDGENSPRSEERRQQVRRELAMAAEAARICEMRG